MRKPKKFLRRSFLNKPGYHSLGAILAKVDSGGSKTHSWVSAEVEISDCSRLITLDFDTYFNAGRCPDAVNAIYKLDVLIETLTAFRDSYLEHVDHACGLLEEK